MLIAVQIYTAIYCLVLGGVLVAGMIVRDEELPAEAWWESPVDLVLFVIGLAGLLFLCLELDAAWLKLAWKPVSVCLAAAQLGLNIWGRYRVHRAQPDLASRSSWIGDTAIVTLLMPALALNVLFAFG